LVIFCITTSVFISSADFSPRHYYVHLELAARLSVYHSCVMQLEEGEWEILILIEKSFHCKSSTLKYKYAEQVGREVTL
jgi:hypothetical protein